MRSSDWSQSRRRVLSMPSWPLDHQVQIRRSPVFSRQGATPESCQLLRFVSWSSDLSFPVFAQKPIQSRNRFADQDRDF